MSKLSVIDKYQLEKLKKLVEENKVNEGIPRTVVSQNKDGTYTAHLEGFQSQTGDSVVDALSSLHDYLLKYYEKLIDPTTPLGDHSKNQLRVLEAFLGYHVCDCKHSPDTYCYCRGFETS